MMKHLLKRSLKISLVAFVLGLLLGSPQVTQVALAQYTAARTAGFGSTKTGLTTVGYTILNASTGAVVTARSTTGVFEIGAGSYGVLASLPANSDYIIKWDTGETSPLYAVDPVRYNASGGSGPTAVQIRQEIDANSNLTTTLGAHTTSLAAIKAKSDQLQFTGTNVNSAAQNLPATYPLSANDESVLTRLFAMTTSGNVYTAASLVNAPSGTGGGATPAQVAAAILVNPANLIQTDSQGRVVSASVASAVTLPTTPPTGYGPGSSTDPWGLPYPGSYAAGTMGYFLENMLVDAIWNKQLESGVSIIQGLRIIGAYAGGNSVAGASFAALGNPNTPRINFTSSTTGRVVTPALGP